MDLAVLHTSQAVVVGMMIVLSLYDLIAYVKAGQSSTISATVWDWSKKYPIFSFAMGVVMGHLFWHSC